VVRGPAPPAQGPRCGAAPPCAHSPGGSRDGERSDCSPSARRSGAEDLGLNRGGHMAPSFRCALWTIAPPLCLSRLVSVTPAPLMGEVPMEQGLRSDRVSRRRAVRSTQPRRNTACARSRLAQAARTLRRLTPHGGCACARIASRISGAPAQEARHLARGDRRGAARAGPDARSPGSAPGHRPVPASPTPTARRMPLLLTGGRPAGRWRDPSRGWDGRGSDRRGTGGAVELGASLTSQMRRHVPMRRLRSGWSEEVGEPNLDGPLERGTPG